MKKLLAFPLLLAFVSGYGQYYYNDIISNDQSNKQYQLLKNNQLQKVKVSGFDADDKPSEGFSVSQELSPDWTKMVTTSSIATGENSVLTTFFTGNKIKRSDELRPGVEIKADYQYNEKGKLGSIVLTTSDTALKQQTVESHTWSYNASGQPTQMLRIKNRTDTTQVVFVYDEQGNVGEEHWKKNGREIETYYYYYNPKNLLTDIVRFNKRAQQLLPDFLFEYDASNRITQMTVVPASSSNYTVWKYTYNDKGLKLEEACYTKQKQLLGKMRYSYQ